MAMIPMGDGVGGEVVRLSKRSLLPVLPLVFLIGGLHHHGGAGPAGAGQPSPRRPRSSDHPHRGRRGGGAFWWCPCCAPCGAGCPCTPCCWAFTSSCSPWRPLSPGNFWLWPSTPAASPPGPITVPSSWPSAPAWPPSGRARARRRTTASGPMGWPVCSIGPILAVLLMGLCLSGTEIAYTPFYGDGHLHLPGGLAAVRPALPRLHGRGGPGPAAGGGLLRPVPDLLPPLEKGLPHPAAGGHRLHLCGLVLFLTGVERGLYARRQLPGGTPSPGFPTTGVLIPIAWWWATSSWRRSPPSTCSTSRWRKSPAAPSPSGP